MKIKFLALSVILIFGITLFFTSCFHFKPEITAVNPVFGQYISGYTSGMVTRKTIIRIELSHGPNEKQNIVAQSLALNTPDGTPPAADHAAVIALPDSSLLDDVFSFEPEIKGKAVWISDRIIEFIPAEILPSNQLYSAVFKLGNVAKVSSDLKSFHFQFSTYPQNLFVTIEGLRSLNDYNPVMYRLTGRISTSDFEDSSLVRKTLKVVQNGIALPVRLTHSYNNNEYYFYVEEIERKDKATKLLVSWDGLLLNSIATGQKEMIIPGLSDFTVSEVRVVENEEQYLELLFSDPILHSQNLKGIITLEGVNDLTYAIEGNTVKVFLPNRVVGDKKLTVTTGIKNFKSYKMSETYTTTVSLNEPKPLVRIKGNGCILPNSNGLVFPFEAISLKAVDVRVVKIFENNVHQFLQTNNLDGEDGLYRVGKVVAQKRIALDYDKKINLKQWNKHVLDLGKLISPDPGAIYRVSIKFTKKDALCDCTDEQEEESSSEASLAPTEEKSAWNENEWSRYNFDDGYDHWYYYESDYSPCTNDYYYGKSVSRNILASDIGLIYKLDDEPVDMKSGRISHAFVNDMITAKPITNATVEYYDFTKQLIASGVTNNEGMLDIALKRKPFLMLAKYGKQRGYLKLLDGFSNSLSKFDVGGEVVQKGVKGYIYGERGVWRPGDSLFLNFIMEDKQHRLPLNHPVKFELQDPNGAIVYQVTKTKNLNGVYDFRTASGNDALTGKYTAVARVGNRAFYQDLKIETVKPNRLKIYFEADKNNDTLANLSVKWLHGAVAKNLHALVNVSLNQSKTTFDKYKNFVFDSPIRSFYSDADLVFDGNLDKNGKASIKTDLAVGQSAPGMLRATYITKVFEEGGDFSIDRYSIPYSPYNTYVGIKLPETKSFDHSFETGKDYVFDIASVTSKGKPVSCNKLQVKVYKLQWRWWYERDEENLESYISRSGTIVIADTIIKSVEGKSIFKFRVNYPEYGRYLVTVSDLEGGHETGQVLSVDWPYLSRANRSNSENANMLNFACDKENYASGENIKLSFPSPSDGMALVSIETGFKVVKKFWIPTKKGETVYEFPSTPEMSPNAYIHVTLVQPHANTKNDLPIRMYGVVPVMVDDPATHLQPELFMADIIKPESVTHVKVKEKNGKKMTYTLAMVDEGLLDLTRFKTPQPWNTFYAREALGVKTWDMYDAVIGAYAGKLDKLISVGGDGEEGAAKGAKANRFKPMVKFMGPFELMPGQEKTHAIDIPNYVGSVRVMVVAENEGAYGNAEKAVAVRKPLMILATLPRVLGPAETVYLPVNVFAMEKHVKDVKVEIEVNDLLSVDGAKQQSMHFDQSGDEVLNFKLNVAEKTGIARVKITATSGKEKSVQEIELDVRTPNPKVTDGYEMVLEPGKSWETSINFKGIIGTNKATMELSSIPAMGIEKRLDYLIQYPHGCIEQTTSSVFPQLYVVNLMDLKDAQKNQIANNIKAGLKRLRLFQTSNGGFSYWPGEGYDSEWGSNYAGHFMIEAEKMGYTLPHDMKSKWIKYQQQQAKNWSSGSGVYTHAHGDETNEIIQAYRLFVLALANSAESGAMNRMREEKNISVSARWRLAAAYELIGQHEVAANLIKALPVTVAPYKELSYSYGSQLRDESMILETLSLLNEKTKAAPLAKNIAKTLSSQSWLSTQETAYSLLAMCEYAGAKNNAEGVNIAYSLNASAEINKSTTKSLYQVKYSDKDIDKSASINVKNNGTITLYAKLLVEGVPLIGDKTASAKDLKMQIVYKNMQGVIIQPSKLQQGTDFMAEVTLSNPGTKGYLTEMALNQVFPSGWEIHNSRMDGTSTANAARYQDIRDDRVYSYYDLAANTSKKIVIHLNATYLGRFYLPTVYSEAMYDNMINARVPGGWVEVVKDADVAGK
ncbi:MAG: hypothetical protein H0W61_03300 [Bacteroidetes bacterium]|nr:hypothetical protein [Bacteroidota bacterium]